MADAIGPGMWVEFIGPRIASDLACMTIGSVWHCVRVYDGPSSECELHGDHCRHGTLILAEVSAGDWDGWCAGTFRPIYRPKSEIIEALKAPAPSEPVPA